MLTGNITYENEIIKNKILSVILIKHFYSQVMNIFVKVHNKKLWAKSFLVIKPKRKLFLFRHWKKHIKKFRPASFNLGQLWLLEVFRHCQTGRNLGAICMTTIQYFLMENVQWKYLQHELWRNNKFCWVVGGNIMPQMKSIFQKYYYEMCLKHLLLISSAAAAVIRIMKFLYKYLNCELRVFFFHLFSTFSRFYARLYHLINHIIFKD